MKRKQSGSTPDLRNIVFTQPVLGSQTVAFAALVTDKENTANITVFLRPSSINTTLPFNLEDTDGDGVFTRLVQLPNFADAETWYITGVAVMDISGRSQFISQSELAARGFKTEFLSFVPRLKIRKRARFF